MLRPNPNYCQDPKWIDAPEHDAENISKSHEVEHTDVKVKLC